MHSRLQLRQLHWHFTDSAQNHSVTIMKRHLVVLASVLVGFAVVNAGAQPAPPPRPSFDGAMAKLFGDNTAFSATMEFHYTQSSGNEMIMPGKVAHLADKSRFDMDMTKLQGGNIPPQAAAQMKSMGWLRDDRSDQPTRECQHP